MKHQQRFRERRERQGEDGNKAVPAVGPWCELRWPETPGHA